MIVEMKQMIARTIAAGTVWVSPVLGAPLTGSGPNLPIPGPNPGEPTYQVRTIGGVVPHTSFNGTWTSPAAPPWIGTFTATGPVPAGTTPPPGTTVYDPSPLAAGYFPAGTYFRFGDVDGGSQTSEFFELRAWDASNTLILTPWLDEPVGVWGSGNGGGGEPILTDMPGWDFDNILGVYTIDGATVTGPNPSVAFALINNQDIYSLEVVRGSSFANFSLAAPLIPEPATMAMVGCGGLALLRRRRGRKRAM